MSSATTPQSSSSVDTIVIGAGAAGLTAAYHIQKAGLSCIILEASDRIGGRLRKEDALADFPIDLGGEWIHGNPSKLLNPILGKNDDGDDVACRHKIVRHDITKLDVWNGKTFQTRRAPFFLRGNDHKWVNCTWWDFYNDNVACKLEPDTVVLNCPVAKIDYGGSAGDTAKVTGVNGETYKARNVVVTVSMKLLQKKTICFVPSLPNRFKAAISEFEMGPALKVFIEFESDFYPSVFATQHDLKHYSWWRESSETFAQRLFYDETYGQDKSQCHVLGMFAYGPLAQQYLSYSDKQALVDAILAELDQMFDGKATQQYKKSVVQMWPQEEYVQTGYTRYTHSNHAIPTLQKPVHNRLWFAGEAIPVDQENYGFAHGAGTSGREAARKVVEMLKTGTYTPTPSRSFWWNDFLELLQKFIP